MTNKITLITPPDFFENLNTSILFVNLSDNDQTLVSKYLATNGLTENINFYVFNQETNIPWLLYALGRCDYKFINFDLSSELIYSMGSYLLARSNMFYQTTNENLASIYSHINQNRITNIEQFLKRISNV